MSTFVAFLRAVNVGKRQMRMADLRDHLVQSGLQDVETYIQTGNVRFTSAQRSTAAVEKTISTLLRDRFGFEVVVLARTARQLGAIGRLGRELQPSGTFQRRYVTFLATVPTRAAIEAVASFASDGEEIQLHGREIWVWLDKPSHEATYSSAWLERTAGPATTRDWKVVSALAQRWGS